ncbi:MAG: hypothetical protein ACYTG0_45975 [Planctomycetota bacterium]|jgi:hypothetical protein
MATPSQGSIDLTGRWQGHYRQSGTARAIVATLVQSDDRIEGTMQDLETEFDRSLFDAALEAGLPPGADEQLDEHLRRQHPEIGNAPIRGKCRLPPESRIQGTIRGGQIVFVKTYQGEHFIGFQAGDKEIGHATEGHAVEYSGTIEPDGNRIEGRWTIYQPDAPRALQGPFVLERVR